MSTLRSHGRRDRTRDTGDLGDAVLVLQHAREDVIALTPARGGVSRVEDARDGGGQFIVRDGMTGQGQGGGYGGGYGQGGNHPGGYGQGGYGQGYNQWERRSDRRYNAGRYHGPRGYQARQWRRGEQLPPQYRGRDYQVDYRYYRLPPPPRGYQYTRVNDDVILTAIATGLIASILFDMFD